MTYNYLKDQAERLKYADWRYKIMDLPADELLKEIKIMSRETLIGWLAWNDRNGVYTDEDSKLEFGKILGKREAGEIMFRILMRDREGWDGMMGEKFIGHSY